jgi:hypothetical protein
MMDIDDDQKDELFSDEDAYADEESGFQIRNLLEVPRTGTMTTQDLHALIRQGLIDLNPDYQRDVVWPESKQIGLIDSLFRNYHIPPVIFSMAATPDGETYRVCLDGKQRLTSIQLFMDGVIPHKDTATSKKYWYTRPPSQPSKVLIPENFRKQFAKKSLTVVEYTGIDQMTERDIFQRVQLGMALTAAEKMQSISGPWADWIRLLQKKYVDSKGGFRDQLQWDTSRGKDYQCLATLVCCVDSLPEFTYPSGPKLDRWLRRVDQPVKQIKTLIEDTLTTFLQIASTPELNYGFTSFEQRLAPVEFVMIGLLLAKLHRVDQEFQAAQIEQLRRVTRREHRDIRGNSRVAATMWKFIKVSNGTAAGQSNGHTSPAGTNGKTVAKRKRKTKAAGGDGKHSEDSDDQEFRPSPQMERVAPTRRQKRHG